MNKKDDRKFKDFYILGDRLGKGGFGDVFKCTHKKTKQLFACKVIYTKMYFEVDDKEELAKMKCEM